MDVTQYVLFVLFLAAGLVTALAPPPWRPLIPDVTGWDVAVYVLAAIISVRLLLAPYWLWSELQTKLAQLDTTDAAGRRLREALETFTRTSFDRVYALAATAALAIHLKSTVLRDLPSGGLSTEQDLRRKLARKPSSVIARAVTAVEAQERFLELLTEYDEFAASIHISHMLDAPPVETFPEYRAWRAEDPALVDAIREFVVRPGYLILHDEISQDWGQAVRKRWPELSHGSRALIAGSR